MPKDHQTIPLTMRTMSTTAAMIVQRLVPEVFGAAEGSFGTGRSTVGNGTSCAGALLSGVLAPICVVISPGSRSKRGFALRQNLADWEQELLLPIKSVRQMSLLCPHAYLLSDAM
jgi:hypothetical protein